MVNRTSGNSGSTPPIQTGYGTPTTGGAFRDGGGSARRTGAGEPTNRNASGASNPYQAPSTNAFATLSPEQQTSFQGATARATELRENAQRRQDAYPDYGQLGEDGRPVSWEELDQQYMPDSRTLANADNSRYEEDGTFVDRESEGGRPEGSLLAFNGSPAAQGTLDAANEADEEEDRSTDSADEPQAPLSGGPDSSGGRGTV